MAIFHLSVQAISRGAGKSLTAATAYRMCARLTDARTGQVHNFRRKSGHQAGGFIGWSGSAEDWANNAEAAERHPRALLAREIVVALPVELDPAAHQRLVIAYATWLRRRHGVGVRWDIHRPASPDGTADNPHAHLLLTSRQISDDGTFGGKTRELDVKQTSGTHIAAWRQTWATMTNAALAEAGATARIDCRSLSERAWAAGLPAALAPQEHLGPVVSAMERQGRPTVCGSRNRQRRQANTERHKLNHEWAETARQIATLRMAKDRRKAHAIAAVRDFHAVCRLRPRPISERQAAFVAMIRAAQEAWPKRWWRPLRWLLRRNWPDGPRVAATVGRRLAVAGALPATDRNIVDLFGQFIEDEPEERSRAARRAALRL